MRTDGTCPVFSGTVSQSKTIERPVCPPVFGRGEPVGSPESEASTSSSIKPESIRALTVRWATSRKAREVAYPQLSLSNDSQLEQFGESPSGRSLRNEPSQDVAFPHPQSRKDQYWKEDIPNNGSVVVSIRRRIINVTENRNATDDVNPAKNRTFGSIFHD